MPKHKSISGLNHTVTSDEKRRKTAPDDPQTPATNILKQKMNNDYTVGWICAISTEYVAAQAFLDEKHKGPEYVSTNDNNDYALGRVGKHNVVISVLPNGKYGISSATGVARDMLHSFPNVRIGLMVGIGGGAPSPKHDIRLGDIVVSATSAGKGGVLQYDFGKTIQDQEFQETGVLDQPPTVLQAAMNGLVAQYKLDGHQLEETINSILEKKPRLREDYRRPDPSTDRLYRTKVTHPLNEEAGCAVVCGDNQSNLIPRRERTKDEDNPAVHYGLIASANRLMKDALFRDKFAKEKDILCFEMEAAGLMNQFPCLVIRGICDYSDSHKNKEWQGYAAMAAAAYAKDLLCRIPRNKVEAEKSISEQLNIVRDLAFTAAANTEIATSKLQRREDIEILDWLTRVDYGSQQSDYLSRRQEGTGRWLLDSAQFQRWVQTTGQTLFCPGIPGAGKTILTSVVVNDLTQRFSKYPTVGLAYIYCNFRRQDEQKIDNLLASLLKQLAESCPSLPRSVKDLYNCHATKRTVPSLGEISSTLHSVAAEYSRVFIIVDALDECQTSGRCRTRLFSEIFNLQKRHQINILATSRLIREIVDQFQGSLQLEIRARDEDVRSYLDHHMSPERAFLRKNVQLQEEIKGRIVQVVHGMFLLAHLHLDSLMRKTTEDDIRNALERLPTGSEAYDKAYEDALERIESQDREGKELAKRALMWIVCATRPLMTVELQHALAIKTADSQFHANRQPDIEDVVSVCAALVTVDEESRIVRLVHYTTQEYFERTHGDWFPNAEVDITRTCVTYLSFDVFEHGFCHTDEAFEERLWSNPFFEYATRNWGHHAHKASTLSQALSQAVVSFLMSEAKVNASSQGLFAIKHYSSHSNYSQQVPRRMTGLHLIAYLGVEGVVKLLLESKADVDSKDNNNQTPLSWAAQNGHEAVVKLLLESKADVDSKDNNNKTPLWWAAENRHEAVVKLLRKHIN